MNEQFSFKRVARTLAICIGVALVAAPVVFVGMVVFELSKPNPPDKLTVDKTYDCNGFSLQIIERFHQGGFDAGDRTSLGVYFAKDGNTKLISVFEHGFAGEARQTVISVPAQTFTADEFKNIRVCFEKNKNNLKEYHIDSLVYE